MMPANSLATASTAWFLVGPLDSAEKARYLLNLFAATIDAQDPRRQRLIAAVLDDFGRLSGEPSDAPNGEP